jgi:malonyl-CoA/methylmalonyl-CoA synthetase
VSRPDPLLAALDRTTGAEALRFGDAALDRAQLRGAALAVARGIAGLERVAVWATPSPETCVAVAGALLAGVPFAPLNPQAGSRELEHMVRDAAPASVLAPAGAELPAALADVPRRATDLAQQATGPLPAEPAADAPAAIVYTSGTTGLPKGAILSRRAIAANLDALYEAWAWTAEDRLVHALPLFHVHGLILGVLGPLRLGSPLEHLGRFDARLLANALERGATMVFGVPTMYTRLADEASERPALAAALRRARLLVSGSAALPQSVHKRIETLTGQRIVERYGMTETLISTSTRIGDERPGSVGPPLRDVAVRLLGEDGAAIEDGDAEQIGEIAVHGPSLFSGYLNRPDATAAVLRDGWFLTGDLATRAADGALRIVGRKSSDLIKSGGFKIGANEVEGALLDHPDVLEAAVCGEPDADLGERVVAWVVARPGTTPSPADLTDHVARLLSPHKRPRTVRFLDALPRNDLGKVQKHRLR